ncbi:MAG: Fe-S protein assembly co-chaperone HscB [Pedobacter sp.]|nr:MAG: Fe-S protein assembly co-chaperone HscB [Pedobacter sp.]
MNYFEFYAIPVQFHPDPQVVKQTFFSNSKKFHPDFYVSASEEKQAEVLEMSSFNNKAFQTLKNEALLIPYVLEILGQLKAEEHYQLPQSFLMEMMDINEALMDVQMDPNPEQLQAVKQQIETFEINLQGALNNLTKQYDANPNDNQVLVEIKDLYFRNKYLMRLKAQLEK